MIRRGGIRAGLAAAGLCALLVAGSAPVAPTEAAWTDAEVGAASVTAGTMTTPVITACETDAGILGGWSRITFTWTSPLDTAQQSLTLGSSALSMSGATRTGPVNGLYTYSLTYTSSLLGGILGSLLGVNAAVVVTNTYPGSVWQRQSAQWKFTTTLAGLFPSCTAA